MVARQSFEVADPSNWGNGRSSVSQPDYAPRVARPVYPRTYTSFSTARDAPHSAVSTVAPNRFSAVPLSGATPVGHDLKLNQPVSKQISVSVDDRVANANARLGNPLAGIPRSELMNDGRRFAQEHDLWEDEALLGRAALVAQDPGGFDSIPELSEEERDALREEQNNRWGLSKDLKWLLLVSSLAAATQGMDESVINGAQLFFPTQFGIPQTNQHNTWILGIVSSAPYLACAVVGCWLTYPLNNYFGRRGALFISSTISLSSCVWQAFPDTWQHLLAARLILGLAIGPRSTTTPVFVVECAPQRVRGALTMTWQTFTAFGIMLGYAFNMGLLHATSPKIEGLNWRLMLASAALPAAIVMILVYKIPESPRWLISKGKYNQAFRSLRRLRKHDIQAARDMYYIHVLLQAEKEVLSGTSRLIELWRAARNRRALLAAGIVMFLQQACGVNIMVYYSSTIFFRAGFNNLAAMASSWGFGALNALFALPAAMLIDTFGRRGLLLSTFPAMAVMLLITGMGFNIESDKGRVAMVSVGIYLFAIAYSPGEGPVPFVYSAEAFPLYVRDLGMSFCTALTWFCNWLVSFSFPAATAALSPQGAFTFYAAWNVVGFFLILFFVPETKALTLEELDQVFSVPTRKHAAYQMRQIPWWVRTYILRQKGLPREELYEFTDGSNPFEMFSQSHWETAAPTRTATRRASMRSPGGARPISLSPDGRHMSLSPISSLEPIYSPPLPAPVKVHPPARKDS